MILGLKNVAASKLLGLEDGKKLSSGLYLPHAVVNPAQAVDALRENLLIFFDHLR